MPLLIALSDLQLSLPFSWRNYIKICPWPGVGEVPLSHPVKSANIRLFWTFDLRQIRFKEQCLLIYAWQCCKNHTKNCIVPNFWFVFEHTETLTSSPPQLQRPQALYQGPIFINVLYTKYLYRKYIEFATLGSYVACKGAKVFKFSWLVIFSGLFAEDEQTPKLVSASPQIPLWLEKSVMMRNTYFKK